MFRLRVYLSHFSWQALRLAFRQTCQTLHQGTASASRQTAMKIFCFDLAEMKTTSTTKANQLDGRTAKPRAGSRAFQPVRCHRLLVLSPIAFPSLMIIRSFCHFPSPAPSTARAARAAFSPSPYPRTTTAPSRKYKWIERK